MNWYILYTSSRVEKQVEQRLKVEGVDVFLALHLAPRKWSDRIKMVEVPLFPSYIFVRTTDDVLRNLLKISGVSRIVFYNGSPAVIKPKEIESIKKFVEIAKGKLCTFEPDDEVLIACGPLKNISGKIKKIGSEYVVLHIEQLNITATVKLNQLIKR